MRHGFRLFLLAAALTTSVTSRADFLYGTDGFTGDLIRIDDSDGSSTIIGNMGIGAGLGLAVNGNTGVAYTRDFSNLYTVDLNTAATTLVGPSGVGITGLTFNAAYTTLYSVNQVTNDFFSVDPTTGTAIFVGNTGLNSPLDLTTNAAGVVYAADQGGGISIINTTTGVATVLFSSVDSRGLTSISFDSTGALYGITLSDDVLVNINLVTGTTTDIGGSQPLEDIRGLGFVPGATPVVPEPSSLALCGLGLACLALRSRLSRRV
jgi:hypothetical protein